ncbi:MAG: MotA/TolQ/ExbB proton channel [Rickettsiaceae bacterium]|jgi:biopolymer transport protein ExbB|nr:MotA/TolQ/ExbB proton channel [Rickettsiaceae bacterium]
MTIINLIKIGGIAMYPILFLAILATALICDKILLYRRLAKLPSEIFSMIETFNFAWSDLEEKLKKLPEENFYRRFFMVILKNRQSPPWWVESRAGDEAKLIEKKIKQGSWALETIITASPLLGLLGTIIGMIDSFKLIGAEGLVNPTGVTSGVAEALIATAFGLLVAVVALFAYNYFSGKQDQMIDELERLGTRMIDHIRLDQQKD